MDIQEILNQMTQSFGGYIPKIIGAVVILIVGWLFALIVSAIVRGALRRTTLDNRLARWLGMEKPDAPKIERQVGKGVFWLIMILVFVAIFQVLNLTIATQPLNQLLNQVFQFIPKLIGAGILLIIAWLVASALRMIVSSALKAFRLDERISAGSKEGEENQSSGEQQVPLTKIIADAVYWLVFLLFLPAVLSALSLQGLLEPVQALLNKLLGFLPNIFAAGLIAVIGWFVARVVQRIVTNLLAAVGLDRLSERVGLPVRLTVVIGIIVYILILIPVIVAALNALALDAITQPVSNMLNIVLLAIPQIFAAGVVLVVAYLLGRLVAGLVTTLLTAVGFNAIMAKLGLGKEPAEGKRTPSEIVGTLALVAIMVFAIFEASNLLGFAILSNLLSQFTVFAGHIILGLIILAIGLYLANLAANAIQTSGSAQAGLLSLVARVAILVLVGAIALRQMGLANEIINIAFGLLLGAAAIAAAIAFGIGGREIAARKLEEWTESIKSNEEQ